jgi:hypothetical protein
MNPPIADAALATWVGPIAVKEIARFSEAKVVSGEDLLGAGLPVQTLRFILLQLQQELSSVLQRLEHPMFDFKSESVRQAIFALQIAASNAIRLDRASLQAVVEKAIYNHLRLLANPQRLLESFFFGVQDRVPIAVVEKYIPFFHDFDFVLAGVLQIASVKKEGVIKKTDFPELLTSIFAAYAQARGSQIEAYQSERFLALTGKPWPVAEPHIATPIIPEPVSARPVVEAISFKPAERERIHAALRPVRIEQIPLHKQFQFVQKLFAGSNVRFRDMIEKVGSAATQAQAEGVLADCLVDIPATDPLREELMVLVASRFVA